MGFRPKLYLEMFATVVGAVSKHDDGELYLSHLRRVVHGLDPSMDWIGLDWVEIFKNVRGLDWFGSETQNIIFEQVNKFNCITVLLLNRNRETDKSCSLHTYIVT